MVNRSDEAPQATKQARGIAGKSAVLFVSVILLGYVVGAIIANNPEVSGHLARASLFGTAAIWAVSMAFPVGWWNLKRTGILAVILFGGMVAFAYLSATRN